MYVKDASSNEADRILVRLDAAVLEDLQYRLRHTRWPDEIANDQWSYGVNKIWLQDFVTYWAGEFDWQQQETWLNSFPHYKTVINGLGIHYLHRKSPEPDAIPLLLLHGWPGSFVQMLPILPLLTDPKAHGMPAVPAFDVVVASLPGFGFSDAFKVPGMAMESIAGLMAALMHDVLGYAKYGVRGSDLGGTAIDQMLRHFPGQVLGAHLTQIIVGAQIPLPADATPAETSFLARSFALGSPELSYAHQHASKPQTLAYGLNDSPAGLAAWICEKYRSWGDTGGNIETRFSKDFLATTLTLYWASASIGPSIRTYYEMVRNRGDGSRSPVPVAFQMSLQDMFPAAPREWAQRSHNVVRFTEAQRGGHFLEWEEPELVARDIQAFFGDLEIQTETI